MTEHPKSLAALCVLRVDFPDFYEALQERPELILEFSRLLFGRQAPETLPVAAADLIRDFVVVKDDRITPEIHPRYRGLRRYLASLQGLRWPRSLQPLLLLSEDPITRQYGPKSVDLYEAFISGDTSGVSEALGHHRDNLPLNRDDLVLLNEVAQGIGTESVARRIGAARVLASIVDRIPAANRRQLLTPLARHMVDFKEVRMNVGPGAASAIITELSAEDQSAVASAFVNDFFAGKIDWQLPEGERPDLEQLTQLSGEAVDLALTVRTATELTSNADAALRGWLLSRQVSSAQQGETTLPFARLEGWLAAYPGPLLHDLAPDYSRQAISHLVNSPDELADVSATIGRVRDALIRLSEGGADSRAELWTQLTNMVSAKQQDVVAAACEMASQLKATAPRAGSAGFLIALSGRLFQEAEDDKKWPLDWESGANTYLDLMNAWSGAIDEDVGEAALPIMHNWAEYSETAAFAIRASEVITQHAPSAWIKYQVGVFSQPLGHFSPEVYDFEGGILGELPDAVQSQAMATLTQATGSDSISDAVGDAYGAFFAHVRDEDWALAGLQQHLASVMDRLVAKVDDPAFVRAILPTVRKTLKFTKEGTASSFLSRLFAASSNSAKAFPTAHGEMIGHWPSEAPPVGAYGGTKIASRALDLVAQTPAAPGMGMVLSSAVDLISRAIADQSAAQKISQAAMALWPNSPSVVATLGSDIVGHLSDDDIVGILTSPQPTEEQAAALDRLIPAVVAADTGRSASIGGGLLVEPPLEIAGRPDGALAIWLDALGDELPDTLRQLLGDDLNDEQAERVAHYLFSVAQRVGLPFVLECLPKLLTSEKHPESTEWVTSNFHALSPLTPTRNEKSALATALIDCLPKLSGEALANTAGLVNSLGGRGALEKRTDILDALDLGQTQVVAAQIPASTILANRAKRLGE